MEKTVTISGVEITSTITKHEGSGKASYSVTTRAGKFGYEMVNICDTESEAEKTAESHVKHIVSAFNLLSKEADKAESTDFELVKG